LGGLFAIADLCREKASQLLKLLQQLGLIPHSLILRVTFLLTWQSMLTMTIWCGSGAVGRLNWQLSTKMPPARKAKTLAGPTWRQTEGAAFQKEYALLPEVPLARKAKALPWYRWRHQRRGFSKRNIPFKQGSTASSEGVAEVLPQCCALARHQGHGLMRSAPQAHL